MRDLSEAVKAAVVATGQRQTLGPNLVFGELPVPILLPSLVTQQASDRLTFSSVDVTKSGNAAVVAPGGQKPTAVTVAVTPRSIPKIAAMSTIVSEDFWEAESVVGAVVNTLLAAAAVEADKQANAALTTATPAPTPAADWISAISAGQAAVNSAAGRPELIVIPAASWPALASEISAAAGLSTASGDAILSVLGSRVILSPQGTSAFVLDPAAAVTVTRDASFLVQPIAGTNEWEIVVDLVGALFVQNPTLAARISVGAAAARESSQQSKK